MGDLTFSYKDTAGVDDTAEMAQAFASLEDHHTHLANLKEQGDYSEPASVINTPFDATHYEEVINVCNALSSEKLQYVFVVGIGGSSLGAKAVYDAVYGSLDAHLSGRRPKLIFLETVDTGTMRQVRSLLASVDTPEAIAVTLITKSGETTETLANFETLYALLAQEYNADISSRVAVVSDEESALLQDATARGFHVLSIPHVVTGRFSVFTAVGLLPLMLSGVDVRGFLRGARNMIDRCLTEEREENPAHALAALWHTHAQHGNTIHNNFIFHPQFESAGKWLRQLLAESVGKQYDTEGNEIHAGIVPLVSIGTTDLHSVAQLYLSGRHQIFTTFVTVPPLRNHVSVPEAEQAAFPDHAEGIHGKTLVEIVDAITSGTKAAYTQHELPYAELALPETSADALGAYMGMHMIAVMDLAHLFRVDAFTQPNVEDYKTETHNLLTH